MINLYVHADAKRQVNLPAGVVRTLEDRMQVLSGGFHLAGSAEEG